MYFDVRVCTYVQIHTFLTVASLDVKFHSPILGFLSCVITPTDTRRLRYRHGHTHARIPTYIFNNIYNYMYMCFEYTHMLHVYVM